MDSNRIKSLATGVRDALRTEISARMGAVLAAGSAERLEAPAQVRAIEVDVREHGRDEVVDRAAYTWFNRLCALRFMDANGYTPTPVVTPRDGSTQPAILADAAQGVFDPELNISQNVRQRVMGLLAGSISSTNSAEDAYAALLVAVCDRYAVPMGYLFAEDVTSSLLMPRGLLSQGSVLSRIVEEMDAEACSSVEVLGWLYQFYIAERKDEVFANYKRRKKAQAADIAPVTQLFTPNWIVRYLTENSLGRLWMLNNPQSELAKSMEYYIAPEGDEPHIEVVTADEIRVLDPACGSGHILVYAFDLLFQMYEEEGWPTEDIPQMILENNLFGLEIDRRAAEIASFALEMKARERAPRWFDKGIDARVLVLEPIELDAQELLLVPQLAERAELLDAMKHLDQVGSLYAPDGWDEFVLQNELEHVEHDGSLFAESVVTKLRAMLKTVQALNQTYHCVVANPPYMGSNNMNPWLSSWVKKRYPDECKDLCTCFIERGLRFAKGEGYSGVVTMESWLFISSFEKLRKKLISSWHISTLAQVFDGRKHADSFSANAMMVVHHTHGNGVGHYFRLSQMGDDAKAEALVYAIRNPDCGWFYRTNAEDFKAIPGWPIAYWASKEFISSFSNIKVGSIAFSEGQNKPGDTARFVRKHWELSISSLGKGNKWIPYAKGGGFRKWYGLVDDAIDWSLEARTHYRRDHVARIVPETVWYRPGITWGKITSAGNSFRYLPDGATFDSGGITIFFLNDDESNTFATLGLLNSSYAREVLWLINPTLNCQLSDVLSVPAAQAPDNTASLVKENVELCHKDWDAFETSWDFSFHPLLSTLPPEASPKVFSPSELRSEASMFERLRTPSGSPKGTLIADDFARWEAECRERFDTLKANEEELNRIFARIYHMEGEVPIEVPDDKVSVRLADRARDARSLVSYAVGCMLGRYSTQKAGLILADQGATVEDFRAQVPNATFQPDSDNVLPVLADEWFDDDIVTGVRRWLAHVYGEETLEENVRWLEESLGKDLRTYLVRDFYADHLKTYQKRPIYWMFQSPKKSFQCLVYMHRYDEGTIGTILTGYLRPLEDKLRARLQVLESPGARAADVREANKVRNMIAELEQWERDVIYPLAHERISIDLDDGVKVNYNKFPKALAKVSGLSDWK